MKAYVYSVYHITTGIWYYGIRKSDTFDLFDKYFTSSKIMKRLILTEKHNLRIKLRKWFPCYEAAQSYESKFLTRVKVVSNPKFYNQAISAPYSPTKDSLSEQLRRENISRTLKEKWQTQEYRELNSKFVNPDPLLQSKRGLMGSQARAEKYKNGILIYKPKSKPNYGTTIIVKNEIEKIVKSNQVPAYQKCGWNRK